MTLFSAGNHRVTGRKIEDPADLCRKTPDDFGAEVYLNSTGDSGLGKSAGKDERVLGDSLPSGALVATGVS